MSENEQRHHVSTPMRLSPAAILTSFVGFTTNVLLGLTFMYIKPKARTRQGKRIYDTVTEELPLL
jgi:hypothetical protein